jgi:hypothetical protein
MKTSPVCHDLMLLSFLCTPDPYDLIWMGPGSYGAVCAQWGKLYECYALILMALADICLMELDMSVLQGYLR